MLTCVTGVAGSGKSSLVAELIETLRGPGGCEAVVVDQRPVGRSSRSNPATYVGVLDAIRRTFAAANRVSPALFSFNSKGSCPECKGRGFLQVELSFLDDVRLDCKACGGRRYREEVLELTWRGRSIHDVLEMTVSDALAFFASVDVAKARAGGIARGLQLLVDVGVGYLRLGQSSGCHGFALDERQDFRGCRHRSPGNRAKSPSVVIHSQPCSMATAASQASGTRLPLAPAASHSRRKIRQWSRPGETETRLGRVLSSSANRIASARELGVA